MYNLIEWVRQLAMSNHQSVKLDSPDALSSLISGLSLSAQIYIDGLFCGAWALGNSEPDKMRFHIIESGDAWLHFDDMEPIHLTEREIIFITHYGRHVISNSPEKPKPEIIGKKRSFDTSDHDDVTHMMCGSLEFKNKVIVPLLESLPRIIHIDINARQQAPQICTYATMIKKELENSREGTYTVVNQLAYLLFVEVIRHQITTGAISTGMLPALFDTKISKALAAIHTRSGERWSLEKLASEASMGRSAFAQKFNELIGMPAMQYLTIWRMQEAYHLLQHSNESIGQIADRYGYESEAAFRKAFKKVTNTTPGSIRKSVA